MRRLAAILACLAASGLNVQPARAAQKPGETYAITLDVRSEDATSDGSSSGSSTDVDTLIERVIAARDNGLEVEFNFPSNIKPQERATVWQLPARVLLPRRGTPELLNEATLEARVDPWLRKAGWTRAQCGKSIFTWNYFVIECEPKSVLRMVERFNPEEQDLHENAAYHATGAPGSAPLRLNTTANGITKLSATMPIDVDAAKHEQADTAVTVAGLNGKVLTRPEALAALAGEQIEGTVDVALELGQSGDLARRTTVSRISTHKANGVTVTHTVTEVWSRRCVAECS